MLLRRLIPVVAALVLGLATALLVVITTTQSASAQKSGNANSALEKIDQIPTKKNGEVKLSKEQRAEFTKGAKRVGGLNEAEIEQVMKDPKAFAGVPTSIEVSDGSIALPSSGSGNFNVAARARGCKTTTQRANYDSFTGNLLHAYRVNKRFCYNGTRVTSIKFITDRSFVTNFGTVTGWRYNGIIGKQGNYFRAFGNPRGGHRSFRRGKFEQCVFIRSGLTCGVFTERPVFINRSRGDGSSELIFRRR